MFTTYEKFEHHERSSNVIFVTFITIVISLFIGGFLASIDFFNNFSMWFVLLILIFAPVIVFIASSRDAEIKTAYYKTWCDKIAGRLDQHKILVQFARQYKIKNWRTRLEDIEADGRWNFHADTIYMHRLADHRDLIISKIYQEYLNMSTEQRKRIIEANRIVVDTSIKYETAKKNEIMVKGLLDSAKSSGEIYKQRQNYSDAMREVNTCEVAKNDALHRLRELERDRENLLESYKSVIYRIMKIYYNRYAKYTETAIRKINQINGLKYTIVDMPSPEIWAQNPERNDL